MNTLRSVNRTGSLTLHHGRIVKLGSVLHRHLKARPPFAFYGTFLNWAGSAVDCHPATVKYSLVQVGLWRGGKQGSPGGPQFIQMQREIIRYARGSVEGRSHA